MPSFKKVIPFLTLLLTSGLLVATFFLWKRFGPSQSPQVQLSAYPLAIPVDSAVAPCGLVIRQYRQIGKELRFLLYAPGDGLLPFSVQLYRNDTVIAVNETFQLPGSWLRVPGIGLSSGETIIRIQSKHDTTCTAAASFYYNAAKNQEIADTSRWFRHGSDDDLLDVRVTESDGRFYLKDFADYRDLRTRTYLVDGIVVPHLEKGLEVRPGYLYTINARWIDAPYSDWWNNLRNRTSRQQAVWINPVGPPEPPDGRLTRVETPGWFNPSPVFSPWFDTRFPEFDPVAGKLVMQYRLNADVPVARYFRHGITHLPRWEPDVPPEQQHWTEYPGFFGDRDQAWFERLPRQEVEAFADRVGKIGAFAYDFEFWHRRYSPGVKQRLIWFSKRIRENHPAVYLFDYWGGAAYQNLNFEQDGIRPLHFLSDYDAPRPNHPNFEKAADGDFLGNYLNVSPVDVYPRPIHAGDADGNTPNNYLVLSAVHASRINKLIPFQQNNKVLWYAWNRHMPLYQDPAVPWHVRTSDPAGELVFYELETMPASQALSLALFSLITADGYYVWHDSQAWGRGENNYHPEAFPGRARWYPADGRSPFPATTGPESPRYWNYPADYFVLGNWMAKQVEAILNGGTLQDLPVQLNGIWKTPETGRAVRAAHSKEPFVTAVVNQDQIAVLALDSFQAPNAVRKLPVQLPDGTTAVLELYGNWPALYRGTLTR